MEPPDGEYLAYLMRIAVLFGTKPFFTLLLALASSRHGLRESDLEALFRRARMPWSASDFADAPAASGASDAGRCGPMGVLPWPCAPHCCVRPMPTRWNGINGLLTISLVDGADRFCARELMHHLWLACLPGVAAMLVGKSDGHWDREYAEGLAQVWALRHSEWARFLARSDGAEWMSQTEPVPGEGNAGEFLLAVVRHAEDLTGSQRNRLTRFVCQDLQVVLPMDFPPEERVRLLENTLDAQLDIGGKNSDGMAAEALCRLHLGIGLTGVGGVERPVKH